MVTQKIKHVLWAQDMERAVGFHVGVFGFTKGYISEHWSELTLGDAIVALHGDGDGSVRESNLSIQVDDAEAAVAAISAAGGFIVELPEQRLGEPIKLGKFRDTEGNEIMLTQWVG
ncbi:MAG: VOC family protein [Roseimicrobium sp.]